MPIEPVMMRLPSNTSFKKLAVHDADVGTKLHVGPLATSTGVAKKCFIVPPLHSEIRAMKPKYLANHHHHHCRESTSESIISELTMPTSLLHPAWTAARPPAKIYAETTQL
jgi:hypothetical protein